MLRARAVMVSHYDEVARFVGLDAVEMIRRAGLRPRDLHNPENWLPAAKLIALIDESASRSGRDDFGILLGKCRTFTSLGPLSLLLKHEATIGKILSAAVEYSYLLNDLLHVSIKDDGASATIEWNLVPGLHSRHAANLVAAIAYRGISEAVEFSWDPDCIHFRDATPDRVSTFKRYFRGSLEFGSNFDGMSCTSAALNTRNPFADPDLARYARQLLNLLPGAGEASATNKTLSTILLMLDDGEISITRAAECLGITVRSLQRRLEAEETSFNQILNETRKELAMRHLANSSASLISVATLLGYSGVAAFGRWFAGEFGMSATEYRRTKRRETFSKTQSESPESSTQSPESAALSELAD
jgi:AraC-like DNA-binding protein